MFKDKSGAWLKILFTKIARGVSNLIDRAAHLPDLLENYGECRENTQRFESVLYKLAFAAAATRYRTAPGIRLY